MKTILGAQEPRVVMHTYMESCQHKEGEHMQSKAMEMMDNLDKNPPPIHKKKDDPKTRHK